MKTELIQETFNENVLNAGMWATSVGTPAASGSQLTFTIALGAANYHGITGVPVTDLTNSFAMTELTNAGNQALVSLEVYPVWVQVDANNGALFLVSGNTVICYDRISGVNTLRASVAYNAVNHRFFRIMESEGNLLWQTSPDRITWTTQFTKDIASLFAVTAVYIRIEAGAYAAEASGTSVTVDNVNVTKKGENPVFVKRLRPAIFSPSRAR